jgi:rhodanese-related sulfurtransferase
MARHASWKRNHGMGEQVGAERSSRQGGGTVRSAVLIVAVGVVLGIAYNYLGLLGNPVFGLEWLARPPEEDVYVLEGSDPAEEAASGEDEYIEVDDPMAVFAPAPDLPEIPDLPRPIQIQMSAAKKFFDAEGAVFVDARDEADYVLGHLPEALNLPFDVAATDPALLESIDTGGRPIITYCGGGECETSISLAWFLLEAGHTRVTYFPNGYSGWEEAGYPVVRGGKGEE